MRSCRATSLLALWLFAACGPNPEDTPVPESVIGLWVTQDSAYVDRAFEITRQEVIIGLGDGLFDRHSVIGALIGEGTDANVVTVLYADGTGEAYEWRLEVMDGGLRFPNQPDIRWSRDPTRAVPWR